jgi:hypothetical protein
VLQENHTIYDLPPGIVVEMFSDEYCTGDATLISQDRCMRLGFDTWQGGEETSCAVIHALFASVKFHFCMG